MFSFAAPLAFLLAAIAVPIIGFYILKIRLRRVPVSTNLFWNQIYEEKKPRSLWQQLRHWMSLLMQLFLLALLVFAIADPFLPWQKQQAKRVCIVIDNSASMSAVHGTTRRIDTAKNKAIQFLNSIRELDQVAIVSANASPQVVVGMTGHVPTLKQAIAAIPITDSCTSLDSAVELGGRLVGDHPNGLVMVFSDERRKTALDAIPSNPVEEPHPEKKTPIAWETIGESVGNLGIVQFQVRRSLVDVTGYEVLASVTNFSENSVEARLELSLNDATVDILPIRLAPGESWSKSLEKTSIPGGVFKAELTKIRSTDGKEKFVNALEVDDQAFAILPARIPQNVLIVSPGNVFLRRAFEANPLANVEFSNVIPDPLPRDRILVFHKIAPAIIPNGDIVVIDPEKDSDIWTVQEEITDPIVTEQKDDSPLMRHLRMDNVIVPKARKLAFQLPTHTLAGTHSQDPILSEVKRPEGRMLVLSVNLEESDLAFRTTFPILVTNALQWFSRQENNFEPAIETGSVHSIVMNRDQLLSDHKYRCVDARGESMAVNAPTDSEGSWGETSDIRWTLGPFLQTGIWHLQSFPSSDKPAQSDPKIDSGESSPTRDGTLLREIAVNLSNSAESNLKVTREDNELSANPQLSSLGWFTRPLWFYIALIGAVVSAVEWSLYQRRVIS